MSFKDLIRKYPTIYNVLKEGYYGIRKIFESDIFGTRFQEWVWSKKHWFTGQKWLQEYFNSLDHPHRRLLIEEIGLITAQGKVMEVGCNIGVNLYLLSKHFSFEKLIGIDINPSAIKIGRKWLKEKGIKNVELRVGKADEVDKFEENDFDVVFTDATLMYIGPDKIEKVIEGIYSVAGKGVVFVEWHKEGVKDFYYDGHWVRDYGKLLEKFVSGDSLYFKKIPAEVWGGGWEEYGWIIRAHFHK